MSISPDTPTASTNTTTSLDTARSAMWVIRLMYAPVDGQPGTSIDGRRTLYSGLIIAADNLDRACDTTLPITFSKDRWGVIVENFDKILNSLESDGLIRQTPSEDYEAKYHLTHDGMCKAAELHRELSTREQEVLEWTRNRHMQRATGGLLSFVHLQYIDPDSELLD